MKDQLEKFPILVKSTPISLCDTAYTFDLSSFGAYLNFSDSSNRSWKVRPDGRRSRATKTQHLDVLLDVGQHCGFNRAKEFQFYIDGTDEANRSYQFRRILESILSVLRANEPCIIILHQTAPALEQDYFGDTSPLWDGKKISPIYPSDTDDSANSDDSSDTDNSADTDSPTEPTKPIGDVIKDFLDEKGVTAFANNTASTIGKGVKVGAKYTGIGLKTVAKYTGKGLGILFDGVSQVFGAASMLLYAATTEKPKNHKPKDPEPKQTPDNPIPPPYHTDD